MACSNINRMDLKNGESASDEEPQVMPTTGFLSSALASRCIAFCAPFLLLVTAQDVVATLCYNHGDL